MYKIYSSASHDTSDEGAASSHKQGEENDDDDDDINEDERADDLGWDAEKRKRQAMDEMDYEDGFEDEPREEEPLAGSAKENDDEDREDGEVEDNSEDEVSKKTHEHAVLPEPEPEPKPKTKSNEEKSKSKLKGKKRVKTKDHDRAVFVDANGLELEVHFRVEDELDIPVGKIAVKTAKRVHIRNSGKIDMCQAIKSGKNDQVLWKDDGKASNHSVKKEGEDDDPGPWALKTAGVDFCPLWEMQDDLDVTRIYCNNIHAMLSPYGVEAARETIIREVKHVFQSYGVEIDYRHLSLIADYMTRSGGYRPMQTWRHSRPISPFLKMSFETASKFIVEAASHRMTDNLETPSSRICLGLPVKMGTGSFDLMQNLEQL